MRARRIPVPESGDINEVWPDMHPGDYCGPTSAYTGGVPAVFYIAPRVVYLEERP